MLYCWREDNHFADVVDRDIPLLTSKAEMKKRGFKLNLEDDSLEVKGRRIELDTTEKGGYKISMRNTEVVNIASIEKKSIEDKQNLLEILPRQFYHPSEKAFKNLMMDLENITRK